MTQQPKTPAEFAALLTNAPQGMVEQTITLAMAQARREALEEALKIFSTHNLDLSATIISALIEKESGK